MCHMLEHVADLRATVQMLSQDAACRQVILAWPELEAWVEKGLAGALNFEHGIYVTVPTLLALFGRCGWRLKARRRWDENDTVFLAFVRDAGVVTAPVRERASAAILGFYNRFGEQARRLAAALQRHDGDAFLMPASVYAQTLLGFGLPQQRFAAVLDHAPAKQGRRLFGTDLVVRSPHAALAPARRPLVVLNGGAHDAEMAASLRAIRDDVVLHRLSA